MKGLSENIAKTTQILKHSLLKTSYSWSMNIVGKKINKWINIQIYIYRERFLFTNPAVSKNPAENGPKLQGSLDSRAKE